MWFSNGDWSGMLGAMGSLRAWDYWHILFTEDASKVPNTYEAASPYHHCNPWGIQCIRYSECLKHLCMHAHINKK